MRIVCASYRDWALSIYDRLAHETNHTIWIIRSREQYDEQAILDFKPDLILFYGWSWTVSPVILGLAPCLMLHPAPLPRYRGGSPIQNQIIAGEKTSMVSIFIMTKEIDAGDIARQQTFSLEGHLDEIFDRLTEIGFDLTLDILQQGLNAVAQDHAKATICKRRSPDQSELTLDELANKPAEYLFDKIRMLEDPYPNAFIRTADGRRLLIKRAELD